MKNNLPILISIPHGGTRIPIELTDKIAADKYALFDDSDPFTREIFNLKRKTQFTLKADIIRACVDLSRHHHDLPPNNPDGVIKSHTCYGKKLYKDGEEPDKRLIKLMLNRYYFPYHNKIDRICKHYSDKIILALDCHSMASLGPQIAPDTGNERPLICLGNGYDSTCSPEMMERLMDCFTKAFELKPTEITGNFPFAGGFITRNYGFKPFPWVQVELNRKLYLETEYFDEENLTINPIILNELNRKFKKAIHLFLESEKHKDLWYDELEELS